MSAVFKDFDEFLAERKAKSPVFRIFGKEYTMPPSLPYAAVLELRSIAKRNKKDELQDSDVFKMFETIFGEKTLKELQSNPLFDIDIAMNLLSWAMETYGLSNKKAEDDPKVTEKPTE